MKATDDFKKFLYYYTIFLNSSKKDSPERKSWISAFNYWAVQSELEFEFYESEEKVFIFPKGVKELDDKLVTEPLQWLTEYPKARTAWINALKLIQPRLVQIYSIDRKVPIEGLVHVDESELREIEKRVKKIGLNTLVTP
jgi:hypothetical protein